MFRFQSTFLLTLALQVACGLYTLVSDYVQYAESFSDSLTHPILMTSGATKKATSLVEEGGKTDAAKRRLSRSMAAHAARSLITTLPYAVSFSVKWCHQANDVFSLPSFFLY
jgi:hypothetical protein